MKKFSYDGKTAFITGASSGIGAAFARELAARGMDVVLVARSEEKLRALAAEITAKHGVKTEVIAADLSQPEVAGELFRETLRRNLHIDLLVNNAGFSTFGSFEEINPLKEQQEITVNIGSLVDLTHAFIPTMLARGEGAIINVASIGGFMPSPRQAVYGATKAFVLSFSEALYAEFKDRGIQVFALCPGATATNLINEMNIEEPKGVPVQTPEQVVSGGLRAFEQGKHLFISGAMNKAMPLMIRLLPRRTVLNLAYWVSKNVLKPRAAA